MIDLMTDPIASPITAEQLENRVQALEKAILVKDAALQQASCALKEAIIFQNDQFALAPWRRAPVSTRSISPEPGSGTGTRFSKPSVNRTRIKMTMPSRIQCALRQQRSRQVLSTVDYVVI